MENNKQTEVGSGYKKYFKVAAYVLGAIIILVIGYFAYAYIQIQRGEYVKWDGEWHTKEELKEKYPPQYGETPAKNTPEEAYLTFRQALLDENLELALEQITVQKREEYREIFSVPGDMKKWGNKLPEKITKEEEHGNLASYDVDMGTRNKNIIRFSKDYTGHWKIYSI